MAPAPTTQIDPFAILITLADADENILKIEKSCARYNESGVALMRSQIQDETPQKIHLGQTNKMIQFLLLQYRRLAFVYTYIDDIQTIEQCTLTWAKIARERAHMNCYEIE